MKFCVMCKHLEVERAWEQDSDSGTSWNGGGFSCKKYHFSEINPYSTESFRELISQAQTCKDYDDAE